MNAPTIIHIGMGKAGSTSLQSAFRSHAEIRMLRPETDPINLFCEGKDISHINFPKTKEDSKIEVISDERFSFYTPARQDGKGQVHSFRWRQLREQVADWLYGQRPNAKIILIRREDDGVIPSAYAHYVRDGGDLTYPRFLTVYQEMFEIMTDTDQLVDLYTKRFGRNKLILTSFEEITANPAKFSSDLSKTMQLKSPLVLPEAPKNAAIPFSDTVSNAYLNRTLAKSSNRNWAGDTFSKLIPAIPQNYPKALPKKDGFTLLIANDPQPLLSLLYFISQDKHRISDIVYFRHKGSPQTDQRFLELALWSCPQASVFVTGDAASLVQHWSTTPSESILPSDFDPSGLRELNLAEAFDTIKAASPIECDTTEANALLEDFLAGKNVKGEFCLIVPQKVMNASDKELFHTLERFAADNNLATIYSTQPDSDVDLERQLTFPYSNSRGDLELALRRAASITFDFDCGRNPTGLADARTSTLALDPLFRKTHPDSCLMQLSNISSLPIEALKKIIAKG